MINNRQHSRYPIGVSIKITHDSIGEMLLETKDISDGGLFVVVNPQKMLPLGTIVEGQVQGMAEDPPIVKMEVVRVTNKGIGLKYVDV
jgi:hypothetical protein